MIWEASAAHQARKAFYLFRESDTEVPMFVSYSTDYFTYDPLNDEDIKTMSNRMVNIAKRIKRWETIKNIALGVGAGLVGAWLLFGGDDDEEYEDDDD